MKTLTPDLRSCRALRRSRLLFSSIFSLQNRAFAFGRFVPFRQSLWPCQKQPCTKTATLRSGKKKSGVPGRLESFWLKLTASSVNNSSATLSGVVFLVRIDCISFRRFRFVKRSAIAMIRVALLFSPDRCEHYPKSHSHGQATCFRK